MASRLLSIDEFFVRLSELFDSRRKSDHGSVFLVQKRLSYGIDVSSPPSAPSGTSALEDSFADLQPASPFPILIRATNGKSKDELGKKIKLSTIVHSDGLENFYQHYADVCKSGMHGLRKRDRAGRKKAKAKEKKVNIEADKMA